MPCTARAGSRRAALVALMQQRAAKAGAQAMPASGAVRGPRTALTLRLPGRCRLLLRKGEHSRGVVD